MMPRGLGHAIRGDHARFLATLAAHNALGKRPLRPLVCHSLLALDLNLSALSYAQAFRSACWARCMRALAAARLHDPATHSLVAEVGRAWCLRPKMRLALAQALVTLDQGLAGDLLPSLEGAEGLRAFMLVEAGRIAEAEALLARIAHARDPDLILLRANIGKGPEEARLGALVTFFELLEIPVVARLASRPGPFIARLRLKTDAPAVDGPMVSVLMAAHNAAGYLESAVASVLGQTWHNLELIIVNDASTDQTGPHAEAIGQRDPRVRVIHGAVPRGPSAARNTALASAAGGFIICHDADDVLHARAIEIQMSELAKRAGLVGVSHNWFRSDENGVFGSPHAYPFTRWSGNGLLYRRQPVVEKAGWYIGELTGADTEFHRRLEAVFGSAALLKLPLALKVGARHSASLTAAPETGVAGRQGRLKRTRFTEATTAWHIRELSQGRTPFIGPDGRNPATENDQIIGWSAEGSSGGRQSERAPTNSGTSER